MSSDLGVLLPVRLETRFKNGDLWLRVVPDEPWFVRDDPRVTPGELAALQRYAAAPADTSDAVPAAWVAFASQVGAPRAAYLYRTFITVGTDGTLSVRTPTDAQQRTAPAMPRIVGFPTALTVWAADGAGLHQVLSLTVDPTRLTAELPDPTQPDEKRWWQDWDEAVATGLAGIIPAASLTSPIIALYVVGIGDQDPTTLFSGIVDDGRLGLLAPGLPTNSVDGAPAAALATDPATWWAVVQGTAGDDDHSVSQLLTGGPATLGHVPGGDGSHRAGGSALVTAMWPALWGFAAGEVFDLARGPVPAAWAAGAMFPEGAYPILRVGSQPYGILPTTAWSQWQADSGDPGLEAPLLRALLVLRDGHAKSAEARGTAAGKDTDALLDVIADTPTSESFRFRQAWPLELWWVAQVSAGISGEWPAFSQAWNTQYPLSAQLSLSPLRRYGARGPARLLTLPLVVPDGSADGDLPGLLSALANAALTNPQAFADTATLESTVLGGHGDSLLLRLATRSLQLLIGDVVRTASGPLQFDPEPFARADGQPGRLESLIATATPTTATSPGAATAGSAAASAPAAAAPTDSPGQLLSVTAALQALGQRPVAELERRLRAAIDASSHRIDPWLEALPQRRLDTLQAAGTLQRRLGAYGWVDAPAPGTPGPTGGGLLHTPSETTALVSAVLRDRAISDDSGRWALDINSRGARTAGRLADAVRAGAFLAEAMGSEVERIVGNAADIETLRQKFPVRTEHAGRRVCDGVAALAADPFPVAIDADQTAALADLRTGLDTYGDLLVADAVHQLVQGRADMAGQIMDAAGGLSRPPNLSLLRTARDGTALSSSIALVLPHVNGAVLPTAPADLAAVSPAATLDPSVAGWLAAQVGAAAQWDFIVGAGPGQKTVTLADLSLAPADALALPLSQLQQLARAAAAAPPDATIGGTAGDRYQQAADLVALIGRNPATARTFSQTRGATPAGEPPDPELVTRYASTRSIAAALADQLSAQVALLAADGLGTADATRLAALVAACAAWGIAPNSGDPTADPTGNARLAAIARLALPQLNTRVAAAPDATAAPLSAQALFEAAAALISPTGQVAITAATPAADIPPLKAVADLDAEYLTVVAAVRPALARLEAHQLTATIPLTGWANRATDLWQTDATDARPLIAAYADPAVPLSPPPALVATAQLDQFHEVVPATDQRTGAAFGFDAPASRAPQAILLAVPPVTGDALDETTVAQIVVETRELAHARMARPIDLDDQLWALVPSGLVPATGAIATPLEVIR